MAWADYQFYTDSYLGVLVPEDEFDRLSARAEEFLCQATSARVLEHTGDTEVKMAACAVADEFYRQEHGGEVTSESVGAWSRSYASTGKSPARRALDAAALHLGQTGMLYRGC